MSILGKIFGRIFPHANAAQAAPAATQQAPQAPTPSQQQPAAAAPAAAAPQAAPQATAAQNVDIEQVLDGLAAKNPQKLNWRSSIVDLMKLVGMDSTLQERKELADELGYTGDKGDSASMNIWLHKEVLRRMQQNGGKVPASLMD
jgi:3-oxoacyl-ACP reductase-like protein